MRPILLARAVTTSSAVRDVLISRNRRRRRWTSAAGILCGSVLAGVGLAAGITSFEAQAPSSASTRNENGTISDSALHERMESILRNMTLDEKVGQLVQYSAGQPIRTGTGRSDYNEMIARGETGALLNVVAVEKVESQVSNIGARSGEDAVQFYVGLPGTSTAQPVPAMKAFQRMSLGRGEKKTVEFELRAETIAIWNDRNEFTVEPAKVPIWVGPDSGHGSAAEMEILP